MVLQIMILWGTVTLWNYNYDPPCHPFPLPRICLISGAVKLSLPANALLDCATTDPPNNTLFPNVNPIRVNVETMEYYLPLVLRLFEISPEGFLTCSMIQAKGWLDTVRASCIHWSMPSMKLKRPSTVGPMATVGNTPAETLWVG